MSTVQRSANLIHRRFIAAHDNRVGVVFLGEEIDRADGPTGGTVCSGRFSGYHDAGGGAVEYERIERVPLDAGLRWARERADDVRVRVGDEMFLAGAVRADGMPALLDGLVVEQRRPAGEAWRDRTAADPPTRWHMEVDLAPPKRAPAPDWDAVVAELAGRAGAVGWTKRRVAPVGVRPNQGWFAAGEDVSKFAVLTWCDLGQQPTGGLRRFHHTRYRLTFALDAPTAVLAAREGVARRALGLNASTAEQPMPKAVERFGTPADWLLLALARPLADAYETTREAG